MDAIQEAVQPEAAPQDEAAPRAEEPDPGEIRDIKDKLKTIHRNLGHPGQEAFLRMLRDAGGTKAVMDVAQTFSCPECLQEAGGPSPDRQLSPKHTRNRNV